MPLSQVDICNSALIKTGQDIPISAMSDNTKAARVFTRIWDRVLDLVLCAHPWPFTIKTVAMAPEVEAPPPGWPLRYTYPADCLNALFVTDASGVRPLTESITSPNCYDTQNLQPGIYSFDVVYGSQGTSIVTDLEGAYLIYSARMSTSDIGRFPPLFCDALSCRLAAEAALSLAGELGARMSRSLVQDYEMALAKAVAHAFNQSRETNSYVTPAIAARGG